MFINDEATPERLPSNRKFGLFFTLVFLVAGVYAYWKSASGPAVSLFVIAALFAAVTAVSPAMLTPLNRLWFGLGMLLGRIVNPVVLGVIFFLILTPVAIVVRLFGRDVLRIKKREMNSYWLDRVPAGPPPESFKDQF